MHLLVPGAYRPRLEAQGKEGTGRVSMHLLVPGAYRREDARHVPDDIFPCLNAPSGAGCLPTCNELFGTDIYVTSQCTFWCRVLTDVEEHEFVGDLPAGSQCTFWCRVLTDSLGQ